MANRCRLPVSPVDRDRNGWDIRWRGGWVHRGNYYIGEGHHRMAAALKVAIETGKTEYVQFLIRYGRWTEAVPVDRTYPFRIP